MARKKKDADASAAPTGQALLASAEGETIVEATKIPELTALGIDYKHHQRSRMKVLAEEVSLKDKVIAMMTAKGLTEYRDPESDVTIEMRPSKVKLKVKLGDDGGGEEAGEEEDEP